MPATPSHFPVSAALHDLPPHLFQWEESFSWPGAHQALYSIRFTTPAALTQYSRLCVAGGRGECRKCFKQCNQWSPISLVWTSDRNTWSSPYPLHNSGGQMHVGVEGSRTIWKQDGNFTIGRLISFWRPSVLPPLKNPGLCGYPFQQEEGLVITEHESSNAANSTPSAVQTS